MILKSWSGGWLKSWSIYGFMEENRAYLLFICVTETLEFDFKIFFLNVITVNLEYSGRMT